MSRAPISSRRQFGPIEEIRVQGDRRDMKAAL
jgi:hypothetical protein